MLSEGVDPESFGDVLAARYRSWLDLHRPRLFPKGPEPGPSPSTPAPDVPAPVPDAPASEASSRDASTGAGSDAPKQSGRKRGASKSKRS